MCEGSMFLINLIFSSSVECESPETLCYGSPHCLDWANDTCDGEVQCLYSEEDEYDCEGKIRVVPQ